MSSLRACVGLFCLSNDCWFVAAGRLMPDGEGFRGVLFVGEMASGSSSSVIDMPFPFFLDISGVTISQLAELLVLQVLFQ